jgi:hypothetical protein
MLALCLLSVKSHVLSRILERGEKLPHVLVGAEVLLLDTGSAISWVSDISCRECPMRVRTCSTGRYPLKKIVYGIGEVSGEMQTLSIGGVQIEGLCTTSARNIKSFRSHGLMAVTPG